MKSSLNITKIALLMLGAMLALASCQRDGVEPIKYELTDDDKGFSSDHARMEFLNEDVENIANMAMWSDSVQSILNIDGCQPGVSHDTAQNKLIISFGTGCPSPNPDDKIVRSGRIIVYYTMQKYWDSGSVHTITFDDYKYDGVRLSGYKKIENRGNNNDGKPFASIIVSDTLHLGANLGYISYNSERTRTYVQGWATPGSVLDDVFEVTGSGAIKRGNDAYSDFNILEALLVSGDCKNIKAGQLQLIPRNGDSRVINYGEGDCDDDARLEIAGKLFDIKL